MINNIIREVGFFDKTNYVLIIKTVQEKAENLAEQLKWKNYSKSEIYDAPFCSPTERATPEFNIPKNPLDALAYANGYGYKKATYQIILRKKAE